MERGVGGVCVVSLFAQQLMSLRVHTQLLKYTDDGVVEGGGGGEEKKKRRVEEGGGVVFIIYIFL